MTRTSSNALVGSRAVLACVLAGGLVAACSSAGQPEPATPEPARDRPGLTRKTPLPPLARDLLSQHMIEHGDSMENLLWSALMLDHTMTEAVVEQILSQPRLSRPSAGAGDTINDGLPDRFFELQDQLYDAAQELKTAAANRDDLGTARAYARMAETCVTCHSLYLTLPPEASRE